MIDTLPEETPLYFFDETSIHTWYVRTKTWQSVEKLVVLPKQASRGSNKTVLGAVGGVKDDVKFFFTVADRTNRETVKEFLQQFLAQSEHSDPVLMVTDNHSSHKSGLIREFLMQQQHRLSMKFLPPYSSVLSPQERVWSQVKSLWSQNMSRIYTTYNYRNFETDIKLVCAQVAKQITPRIMKASDEYFDKVRRNILV